jgi:protein-tyrosine phosphatase
MTPVLVRCPLLPASLALIAGALAACSVTDSIPDSSCPDCVTAGSHSGPGGSLGLGGKGAAGSLAGDGTATSRSGASSAGGAFGSAGSLGLGGSVTPGGAAGHGMVGGHGGSSRAGGAVSSGGVPSHGGSVTCQPGQGVLANHVVNARDLGGTPLQNGATVACGVLYRGSPPAALSEAGCTAFAELGVRTVIDLRIPAERELRPDSACVADGASMLLAPLPVPYYVSPEDYIADLNATDSISAAFGALGNQAAYPVYFHCTWGRDRTGVLGAVILLALGAQREAILAEYLLSAGSVGAFPISLTAVLDEIERRGGVEAYLASAGVTEAQIAALRARAIAG